jgi:hypothetical protein
MPSRLLFDHHPPAHPARGLQIRRRPPERNPLLHPRTQPIRKPLHLDKSAKTILAKLTKLAVPSE